MVFVCRSFQNSGDTKASPALRSWRQHRAWGGAKAEPQVRELKKTKARVSGREFWREADADAVAHSVGWRGFCTLNLGFRFAPPQPLCYRLLRRLEVSVPSNMVGHCSSGYIRLDEYSPQRNRFM